MRKIVFVSFFLIFFSSCVKNGVTFEVKNQSGIQIDSVHITNGYSSVVESNIGNGKSYSIFLPFDKGIKIRGDGSYQIRIYNKTSNREMNFGYFSNGIPLAEEYEILIEKDTILFHE
ncbi:hypothetical protein J8L85_03695 [Maribacter sp. MMG018]|uniref:hypothetical protein n=1 Tax=Maribacter sp. MMG018 TaxID=2822688 RepID=UPI001B38D5E8|nr:hypothetical protein [Maribacter sp. MMG018]MBQ4913525.1 hypothetical protein [Maribacter sp. MMG018]